MTIGQRLPVKNGTERGFKAREISGPERLAAIDYFLSDECVRDTFSGLMDIDSNEGLVKGQCYDVQLGGGRLGIVTPIIKRSEDGMVEFYPVTTYMYKGNIIGYHLSLDSPLIERNTSGDLVLIEGNIEGIIPYFPK